MSPPLRKLKKVGLISLFGASTWATVATRASAVQVHILSISDPDGRLYQWMTYLINPPQTANLPFQLFSLVASLVLGALLLVHAHLYDEAVKEGDKERQKALKVVISCCWLVNFSLLVEIGLSVHQLAIHWHTSPHPFWIFPILKLIYFGGFVPIILWHVGRKSQRSQMLDR